MKRPNLEDTQTSPNKQVRSATEYALWLEKQIEMGMPYMALTIQMLKRRRE
jgi:hypothetical protein